MRGSRNAASATRIAMPARWRGVSGVLGPWHGSADIQLTMERTVERQSEPLFPPTCGPVPLWNCGIVEMASPKDASTKRASDKAASPVATPDSSEPPAKVAEPSKPEMERAVKLLQARMTANKAEKTKLYKKIDDARGGSASSGVSRRAMATRVDWVQQRAIRCAVG
jgi:hypothetical protein